MAQAARRRGWALPSAARATVLALALPVWAQDTPQVFGDWEMACAEALCTLSQANAEAGTGNIRMQTEFSLPAPDRLLLSVTVPTAVLLSEGPWLTVDGLYLGKLDYVSCTGGCLSQAYFSGAEIGLLAGGQRAVVTVTTTGGQRLGISVSLAGLTEGLTALVETGPNSPDP